LKPEHTKLPVLPPNAHLDSDCRGVASVLARVGDKWSVFVIMLLGDGPRRFNEIKRMVGGISQRMLTLTLRGTGARWSGDPNGVPDHSATRRL
jgi:DNA-binding HxlR family transcriptional regulator